jgi:primosomal protein N' (replication factor Y)
VTGGEDAAALVGVAVPVPLRRTFTYRVPGTRGDGVALGMRVLVPFGRRSVKGTVVEWPAPEPAAGVEVKDLGATLGLAALDATSWVTRFVADYYLLVG